MKTQIHNATKVATYPGNGEASYPNDHFPLPIQWRLTKRDNQSEVCNRRTERTFG